MTRSSGRSDPLLEEALRAAARAGSPGAARAKVRLAVAANLVGAEVIP